MMTARQLTAKLSWRTLYVANLLATYLVFRFAFAQFRSADTSPVGGLVGVEALTLWGIAEVAVIAVLAVHVVERYKARR